MRSILRDKIIQLFVTQLKTTIVSNQFNLLKNLKTMNFWNVVVSLPFFTEKTKDLRRVSKFLKKISSTKMPWKQLLKAKTQLLRKIL
jgi:hypothetical protein